MSVFGAVTNLFNEEFVENIGYSTLGRNFRLGLNLSF
jgi:vitamin B12 transporter